MSEPAAKPPDRCRYCGGRVLWHGPGGLVFGDGSVGHLTCYEEHETRRQAAKRERVTQPEPNGHDAPGLLEEDLPAEEGAA
jgi:hypothetical protein